MRGGSRAVAAAGHGYGILGRCRRRDGALVAAYIADRIRVIGVVVCSLVLDALVPIRAVIVGAFVPVARAVLAPVAVAVLMVPPVCSDCRRSLVSRVVSRDHGIFRSRVIVAAIRRGETIGGAVLRYRTYRLNLLTGFFEMRLKNPFTYIGTKNRKNSHPKRKIFQKNLRAAKKQLSRSEYSVISSAISGKRTIFLPPTIRPQRTCMAPVPKPRKKMKEKRSAPFWMR